MTNDLGKRRTAPKLHKVKKNNFFGDEQNGSFFCKLLLVAIFTLVYILLFARNVTVMFRYFSTDPKTSLLHLCGLVMASSCFAKKSLENKRGGSNSLKIELALITQTCAIIHSANKFDTGCLKPLLRGE